MASSLDGIERKKITIQFMITWEPEIDGGAKIAHPKDATGMPSTLSIFRKRPWRSMASARKLVPTAILRPIFGCRGHIWSCFYPITLMTTVFDTPAGLAGMLSAIISLNPNNFPANGPDTAVIGMLLYAIESIYGDTEEGRDACRIITERYAFRGPYTIAKADSLEVMLDHSSDHWVRQFLR